MKMKFTLVSFWMFLNHFIDEYFNSDVDESNKIKTAILHLNKHINSTITIILLRTPHPLPLCTNLLKLETLVKKVPDPSLLPLTTPAKTSFWDKGSLHIRGPPESPWKFKRKFNVFELKKNKIKWIQVTWQVSRQLSWYSLEG